MAEEESVSPRGDWEMISFISSPTSLRQNKGYDNILNSDDESSDYENFIFPPRLHEGLPIETPNSSVSSNHYVIVSDNQNHQSESSETRNPQIVLTEEQNPQIVLPEIENRNPQIVLTEEQNPQIVLPEIENRPGRSESGSPELEWLEQEEGSSELSDNENQVINLWENENPEIDLCEWEENELGGEGEDYWGFGDFKGFKGLCSWQPVNLWSLTVVSALLGMVFLGQRWHRERWKNRLLMHQLCAKDEKISELLLQIAKLKERASGRTKVPVIRIRSI